MRYGFALVVLLFAASLQAADRRQLAESLLFHSSFDSTVDADYAKGDARMYTAQSLDRKEVRAGLHVEQVVLDKDTGRHGGSLHFKGKTPQVLFYKGGANLPYDDSGFDGTVSLWMQLSPDEDLPLGYVDPLLITDKKWNDSAIFIDFSKDVPRSFRLGVFSEYKFWNPDGRPFEQIPDKERPMISVARPIFSRETWTHVALTYRNINRDGGSRATLYLDGKPQGHLDVKQRFRWERAQVVMMLGIVYVGRIDDLAVFDRAISEEDVMTLRSLSTGIRSLR